MKRTVSGKPGKKEPGVHAGKNKNTHSSVRAPKPTKDAPFEVDVLNDGDIASPRRDLSEDEIKEQEDRRS
ncbi:MAG: hypothetical protein K2X60_09790 [Xanthobacteraceae bacterium]|nr:hypothetical protein [Xanthobacteraceae bacterium]